MIRAILRHILFLDINKVMVDNRVVTHNGQTAYLRASISRSSQVSESPSRQAGASILTRATPHRLQQLSDGDLFATLLFDRKQAYQSLLGASSKLWATPASGPTKRNSLTRPTPTPSLDPSIHVRSARKEIPDDHDMSTLGSKTRPKTTAVTKKRGRNAEPPTKMVIGKNQKYNTRRTSPRLAKRQKMEANSKKKVDDKSGTTDKRRTSTLSDAIVISSDDEAEVADKAPVLRDADPDSEKDVKPVVSNVEPTPGITENIPVRRPQPESLPIEVTSGNTSEGDPDSGTTQDGLQNALARLKSEHAQEAQRLSQELDTAKMEIERIQRLHDTAEKDRDLEQVRTRSLANGKYAATVHDLESERRKVLELTRENEGLRLQVDNAEAESDILAKELADTRAQRTKENTEHESILADTMKTKEANISANNALQSENQQQQHHHHHHRHNPQQPH